MPFGIDEIIFIISSIAAGSFADSLNKDPTDEVPGGGIGQGAGGPNAFALPQAPTKAPGDVIADPGKSIDLAANSEVVNQIAKVLAAQGPAPVVPLEPSPIPFGPPGQRLQIPAAANNPPNPTIDPTSGGKSVGEVLSASPQALEAVANLLGLGPQEDTKRVAAPIPSGTVGNLIPGFQLPQTLNIGQLLAQIPRL